MAGDFGSSLNDGRAGVDGVFSIRSLSGPWPLTRLDVRMDSAGCKAELESGLDVCRFWRSASQAEATERLNMKRTRQWPMASSE